MFNVWSVPTFATVFLFWVLAVYVGTRGPRTSTSLAVVFTQVVAAAYLFGQAMLANAQTLSEWTAWSRGLQWGVAVGPALWYTLTALLLKDEPKAQGYLRRFGYPLAGIVWIVAAVICLLIYSGDALYVWSAPVALSTGVGQYFAFRAPTGPWYVVIVGFMIAVSAGALANVGFGMRVAPDDVSRRHFRWLVSSVILICLGTVPAAVANWRDFWGWPVWLGHLALAIGPVVMVVDVAAYSFFLRGRVIRTDLSRFVMSMVAIGAVYLAATALLLGGYRFQTLAILALLPLLAVLTHAAPEYARAFFDRLVFAGDVRQIRSRLSAVMQEAATTPDLTPLLTQARTELQAAQSEHDARLVELALRRLNNPGALGRCDLKARIPATLRVEAARANGDSGLTPVEEAKLLRQILADSIAGLQSDEADRSTATRKASDLFFNILNDEYLQGIPNKQIMRRYAIGEGTFHRYRREAIALLTSELLARESRLAAHVAVFGGSPTGSGSLDALQ